MPVHAVKQGLQEGPLAKQSIEDLPEDGLILSMIAVYLSAKPPGPAGRWLIERLKQCSGQRAADQQVAQSHALETSTSCPREAG
jgi:hypothetical protein